MLKCLVYSNGILIGSAELVASDPPMGSASGPFYPNEKYTEIQDIIRGHHLFDGTLGEVNEQKLMEAQAGIDALGLSVVTENGETLEPSNGFDIVDFSGELKEDPFELEVFGLPFEMYDRLFPSAWEEYDANLKEEEGFIN